MRKICINPCIIMIIIIIHFSIGREFFIKKEGKNPRGGKMRKVIILLKLWLIYAVVYFQSQVYIFSGITAREAVEFAVISGVFFFILLFFNKNKKLLIIPVIMIMKAFGVSLLTQIIVATHIICVAVVVCCFLAVLATS